MFSLQQEFLLFLLPFFKLYVSIAFAAVLSATIADSLCISMQDSVLNNKHFHILLLGKEEALYNLHLFFF